MADIFRGNTSLSKIYRGQTELSKVYRGQTEIWSSGGTGGLPAWSSNYTIFYSADQSTDFTDQSGNTNNGTINTVGSGGVSSLTHTGGATPYWDFATTDGSSEQKYVTTGISPGSIPTTDTFTLLYLFQSKATGVGIVPWDAIDSGTDVINSGVSRTSNLDFVNLRNGSQSNINSTSTISPNTWYLALVTGDGAGSFDLYLNNVNEGSNTSINLDVSAGITIGRNVLTTTFAVANFRLAAWGWGKSHFADATERTDIFNYYDSIYTL